jgi:hypothetical protein
MEERIKKLEQEISQIKDRNIRVEANKSWETSWFRVITISVITYVVASVVLYLIGVSNYILSALIPTVGYFLSTMSLPVIKNWWIDRHIQ